MNHMTNLLVLYSGESMESLKLICGTSDPAINMLFAEMMKDALDEDMTLSETRRDSPWNDTIRNG